MPTPETSTAPPADATENAAREAKAEEGIQAVERWLDECKTMGSEGNQDAASARTRYAGWLDKILEEAKALRQEYAACITPEGLAHLDDLYSNIEAVGGVIVRNLKG